MKIKITWANFFLTLATFMVAALTLYYTIPKSDLTIFFDPSHTSDIFTISNLGSKPIDGVKFSYSLDCRNFNYSPRYILAEVPILTESNGPRPFYSHQLDNITVNIVKNAEMNKEVCDNTNNERVFIPYSEIRSVESSVYSRIADSSNEIVFDEIGVSNHTKYYCDSCSLVITVTSSSQKKRQLNYSFINPVKLNVNLSCFWVPNESPPIECRTNIESLGPYDIDLTWLFNSDNDGIIFWFPSKEEMKKIKPHQ